MLLMAGDGGGGAETLRLRVKIAKAAYELKFAEKYASQIISSTSMAKSIAGRADTLALALSFFLSLCLCLAIQFSTRNN